MNKVEQYLGSTGAGSQTSRALAKLDTRTVIQVAAANGQAVVDSAKMDALAGVAQRAMQGVAFVSQVEQQLGQVVPLAVTRLQAIGDLAALGMGQVLADAANQVRGR